MISYDHAQALMLDTAPVLPAETAAIDAAGGRFLSQPVRAAIDAPRADVSAMDGYALRRADAVPGQWLTVVGEAAAGAPFAGELHQGDAARIFTGAHVPPGADCVIMQEYAHRDGARVRFAEGFGPDSHIRLRAGDFARGDVLLEQGQRLTPRALVALAGADVGEVELVRQPQIVIIATGDELEQPGRARKSLHSLPESASYGVAALAIAWGATLIERVHGQDDLDILAPLARNAIAKADCVVVIGGASIGERDFARPMFGGSQMDETFSKVAIKPGKPVWFGLADGTPVLGLPGNPTSAMVTARLFLAPLLVALQGGNAAEATRFLPQVLCGGLPANGTRETFVRARSTEHGLLPARNQESGAQAPLAASDWLIRRPTGADAVGHGEIVSALPF
ncbi:molybdopterin molybdotransferase MoeA [Qipengyuania sp. MTN3-11]